MIILHSQRNELLGSRLIKTTPAKSPAKAGYDMKGTIVLASGLLCYRTNQAVPAGGPGDRTLSFPSSMSGEFGPSDAEYIPDLGLWLACGKNAHLYSSPDAKIWTLRYHLHKDDSPLAHEHYLRNIVWHPYTGKAYAIGTKCVRALPMSFVMMPLILSSSDGIAWTASTRSVSDPHCFNTMAFDATLNYVCGDMYDRYLWTNISGTWAMRDVGPSGSDGSIVASKDVSGAVTFVAAFKHGGTHIYTSTNMTSWTYRTTLSGNPISLVVYNDLFYLFSGGHYHYSSDGASWTSVDCADKNITGNSSFKSYGYMILYSTMNQAGAIEVGFMR